MGTLEHVEIKEMQIREESRARARRVDPDDGAVLSLDLNRARL